jgi:hypothetical protein
MGVSITPGWKLTIKTYFGISTPFRGHFHQQDGAERRFSTSADL